MSSMAKIFVVLNLVFVLALFGAAGTLLGAQDNYKSQLEAANTAFEKFKNEKAERITSLEKALGDQNSRAAQMATEHATAVDEANKWRTAAGDAKQLADKLGATVQAMAEELKGLRATIDANRAAVEAATKRADDDSRLAGDYKSRYDSEVTNRVRLEGDLVRASEERDALSVKLAESEKSLRDTKFWLDQARERLGGDFGPSSKGAEGVVKEVKPVQGQADDFLVAISVGSKDGVRIGDEYQVSRGNRFVCSIRLFQVEPALAVGRVVRDTMTNAGPPQAGDKAWVR